MSSSTLQGINHQVEQYTMLTIDGLTGSLGAGLVAEGDLSTKLMTGVGTAIVHQFFHNQIDSHAPPNAIKNLQIPLLDGFFGGAVAYMLGGFNSAAVFGGIHATLHPQIT